MLPAPSQTSYILFAPVTWADTCSHMHAFRVECVSWKIGLKAEPVARWRLCHIWYFFFSLLVLFSLSHWQYLLCPWHLNVIRCKYLISPTMHILLYNFSDYSPPIWDTLSPPPHSALYKSLIFSSGTPWDIRHSGTENKRKIRVSWQKIGHRQTKTYSETLNVAYTW